MALQFVAPARRFVKVIMNTNIKHLTQGTRIFDVVYETVELNTEIYIPSPIFSFSFWKQIPYRALLYRVTFVIKPNTKAEEARL
jgi:hypothetical protein